MENGSILCLTEEMSRSISAQVREKNEETHIPPMIFTVSPIFFSKRCTFCPNLRPPFFSGISSFKAKKLLPPTDNKKK